MNAAFAGSLRRYGAASASAAVAAAAAAAAATAAAAAMAGSPNILATAAAAAEAPSSAPRGPRLLFLGSGSSTGCPKPICALAFDAGGEGGGEGKDGCSCRNVGRNVGPGGGTGASDPSLAALRRELGESCRTSVKAAAGDPRTNRDYRGNPSLVISHCNQDGDGDGDGDGEPPPLRNVVIDVGKTFRENALRWLPKSGVRTLDAIVLTHEHMDAIGGLDDVRGFQRRRRRPGEGGAYTTTAVSTPVYLSEACMEGLRRQFHYLVPDRQGGGDGDGGGNGDGDGDGDGRKSSRCPDTGTEVVRAVAALRYHLVRPFRPFFAAGLRMVPLPVKHGEDLICLGFAFTVRGQRGKGQRNGGDGDGDGDGDASK